MGLIDSTVEDRDSYTASYIPMRVHDVRADQRNAHAKIAATADIEIDTCNRRIRVEGRDRIGGHVTGKCGHVVPSRRDTKRIRRQRSENIVL